MKKRMIALLLVLAVFVNSAASIGISAFAVTSLTDEELADNVQSVRQRIDEDGYTEEYNLFTSMLDKCYSEEECRSIYSLSAESFEQILKWLKKYIENGAANGFSSTSSVEMFFNYEREFLLDYFVNGTYANDGVDKSKTFTKDLPDSYWFQNVEELPDTLTFSVQVDRAITTEEVQWVVTASSRRMFQNYAEQIPYRISTNGLSSELTLSAEDLLTLTAPVSEYDSFYQPDTVAVYAVCGGVVSNICYVTVGGEAAITKGAHYGAAEQGEIALEVSGAEDFDLQYTWSYNLNSGPMDDYYLTMQGYWELMETSSEVTLNKDNTEGLDTICYARCSVTYTDADGILHLLSAPMMPVLPVNMAVSDLEQHLYLPITCFLGDFSSNDYVSPDTDVTYAFFTLADDAEYSTEWHPLTGDESYVVSGCTYHVPSEWAQERRQMDIVARAQAPSGLVYENSVQRVTVMQEGAAYFYDSMRQIDESVFDRQVVAPEDGKSISVLTLGNTMVLRDGSQYSLNGWGNSKLSVRWYVNSVPSYDNAEFVNETSGSYGSVQFNYYPDNSEADTALFYFFRLINKAGTDVYTSDIFKLGIHTKASLAGNEQFYVTEKGTLYAVMSEHAEITVPEEVEGVPVKRIAANAFRYCENVETVSLPATVESVEKNAFETINNSVRHIHFSEGLLRIEDGAFPGSLETVNFPSTLTYVCDFPYNKIKEVTVSIDHACTFTDRYQYDITIRAEKIIFSEGISIIGDGGVDFGLEADEVVLPSTLKTLAPTKSWTVGTLNLPEGIETIDFGGSMKTEEWGTYYSCDSNLGMSEIVVPDSVKTLRSLGIMENLTSITIPEGLTLPEGFFANSGLTEYTIPEGMTVIPKALFCGSYLETVVIPEGVTEIGAYAFAGSGINTVILPSTLQTIGDYAFESSEIETIVIPDTVTNLGEGVFQNCENLSSVTLPKHMTQIPAYTFQNCTALSAITLPNTISRIAAFAFSGSGLTETITLPDALLTIAPYAFAYTQLNDISLPNALRTIGDYAFVNVPLAQLHIPASVTQIGSYAFAAYEPWGEPSMRIPYCAVTGMEGVRFLGQYAFAYSSLTSFVLPNALTQLHKGLICGTDIASLDLQSNALTFIGDYAFEGTQLTSLTIPDSVTVIGNGICKDCDSLTELILPENAFRRVPAELVSGCSQLTSINLPEGITEIGAYAFASCNQLNSITISDSVKVIGECAFYECRGLQGLVIPSCLEYVYDYAFASVPICEASFSDKLAYIGAHAFENCCELTSVTFQSGVNHIGAYAFCGCSALTCLVIPDSVVSVGNHFIKDSGVTEVTLSSSLHSLPSFKENTTIQTVICYSDNLNSIPAECFMGCTNLETCLLASGEGIYTRAFAGCVNLQSFHATGALTLVGYEAFKDCTNMLAFSCGGENTSLETIGSYAFANCSALYSAEIGDQVRTIGDYAFYHCAALEELKLPTSIVRLGSCAFRQSSIHKLLIGGNVTDISVGTDPDTYGRKKSCFYDMPELETVVFLDRAIGVLYLEDCFMFDPKLAKIYRPSSVGRLKAVNGIDLNYAGFDYDAEQDIFYGINEEIARECDVPVTEGYAEALLPGYVGTTDYRYGSVNVTEEAVDHYFMDIYKPTDCFVSQVYGQDYERTMEYYSYYAANLTELNASGSVQVDIPSQNEFVKGVVPLTDYSVKVLADGEDITDKVEINWYINWLDDNVLQTGASLAGFAMAYADDIYHFTVTLGEDYYFRYEDYESPEFTLTTADEGKVVEVNLSKRETAGVTVKLPDEVKNTATLSAAQTLNGKVQSLNVTVQNGEAVFTVPKDANLLVYCSADGYYRFCGGIGPEAMTGGEAVYEITMTPLPKQSTYKAKFDVRDILPSEIATDGEAEVYTEIADFEGFTASVHNITTGAVTEDLTLEYPYIVIENFETFCSEGDTLELILTPTENAEAYGLTATLMSGSDAYGRVEGTLDGYAQVFVKPVLPEDSNTGKAIIQIYNLLGERVSYDTVESNEILVRRFKNGAYTVTAMEQNGFVGGMEKLSTFVTVGWTTDEYFRRDINLKAPTGQYVECTVPAAPDYGSLLAEKPVVVKNDEEWYQPAQSGASPRLTDGDQPQIYIPQMTEYQEERWYWTSEVTIQATLGDYTVKNASLIVSFPSTYTLEAIYHLNGVQHDRLSRTAMTTSADGSLNTYTYNASCFEDTDGEINLYVCFRSDDKATVSDLQQQGSFDITLKCDASFPEETKTVYVGLGSVSSVNKYVLSNTIGIIHASEVNTKYGIPVEIQAAPFADVEFYADGTLVATGKTNYLGLAVLKYDAPFEWLWWEYDVYAVVRLGDNLSFTTEPQTVTVHESGVSPVSVTAELVIRDAADGTIVFPTDIDPDNTVSVNYQSGERKSVIFRSLLTEGKKYTVTRTLTAKFNTGDPGAVRHAAITYTYTDAYNNQKENLLYAEWDSELMAYTVTEDAETFVYNPANMLVDLKVPTELGVEWENGTNSDYILLPGQIDAMVRRELGLSEGETQKSIAECVDDILSQDAASDPFFAFYTAEAQAFLLDQDMEALELIQGMADAITDSLGFDLNDITQEEASMLASGSEYGTFEPSDSFAAELREDGYTEYAILGFDNGLFIKTDGSKSTYYDFSEGTYYTSDPSKLVDWMEEKYDEAHDSDMQLMAASPNNTGITYISADTKRILSMYDPDVYKMLFVLDEMSDQQLRLKIDEAVYRYAEDLKKLYGESGLYSWLQGEAKYGRELYESYLEDTPVMNTLDAMNEQLGRLSSAIFDDGSPNLLMFDQFGNLDVDGTNALLSQQDFGDLPPSTALSGNISTVIKAEVLESASVPLDIAQNRVALTLETLGMKIEPYQTDGFKLMNNLRGVAETGSGSIRIQYNAADGVIPTVVQDIESTTAWKTGALTKEVKTGYTLRVNSSNAMEVVEDGTKTIVYKAANGSSTATGVILNANNNELNTLVAQRERAAATQGKLAKASTAVNGVAQVLSVVTLVDSLSAFFRDMQGQLDKFEAGVREYGKATLSMLEYADVYNQYILMILHIRENYADCEYFTLLPVLEKKNAEHYTRYDEREDMYDGNAFYWAIPAACGTYTYADPTTGVTTDYPLYTVCNFASRIDNVIYKRYYDEDETYGERYVDYVEMACSKTRDILDNNISLCSRYSITLYHAEQEMIDSYLEMFPAAGLVFTMMKSWNTASDKIHELDYLHDRDSLVSNIGMLEDIEQSISITKVKIYTKQSQYKTTLIDAAGKSFTQTYITYEEARERWYRFVEAHWFDGQVSYNGDTAPLTYFPTGHPFGENYTSAYDFTIEAIWKPTHEDVAAGKAINVVSDSYGTIYGWNLDFYSMEEGFCTTQLQLSRELVTVKWKAGTRPAQIDPAGYVYEAVASNRVSDAEATLYCLDNKGEEVLWDAAEYDQQNPLMTDAAGRYSWLTPSGFWKVRVSKEGYLDADTENDPNAVEGWLPVPPPQLDINIGLTSTLAPAVESEAGYVDGAELVFSQYMDIDSFVGKVALTVDGEPVDCVFAFADSEQAGSGQNIYYGKTLVVSRLDGAPLEGSVTVSVDGSVKNYAGTVLGESYTSEPLTIVRKAASIVFAQDAFSVSKGRTLTITGRVLESAGYPLEDTNLALSVSYGSSAILQNVLVSTDDNGIFAFDVKGASVGSTVLRAVCGEVENTVVVNTSKALTAFGKTAVTSAMPVCYVIMPNGSIEEYSESGTIELPKGSKLRFRSAAGKVGYTTDCSGLAPWWCEDYALFTNDLTAEECTYRIVAKESDKNYSSVLTLTIQFREETALRGDVNADGSITSDDAIYLLNYTLDPSSCVLSGSGDMDGNGIVNSDDAIYLLNYTLDKINYPLGGN